MALLTLAVARREISGNSPLVETMRAIRSWLDDEGIEPAQFKTVVGRKGLGFEISFRSECEAERFQKRFASLLA
jgi:hypothetical protein